jgi:cytochrome c oxidase subunit II
MMVPRRAFLAVLSLLFVACGSEGGAATDAVAMKITAKQWSFDPPTLTLQKGVPVKFELTSADVHHRFYVPDFNVDVDIFPGATTSVQVTPDQAGTFPFRCEYYCGMGHEGMVGHLVVE